MNRLESKLYLEDVKYINELNLPLKKLENKSIFITGATGLIGSFLIDAIMYCNENDGINCSIYALGLNEERMKKRFEKYLASNLFHYILHDINKPLELPKLNRIEYVLHLASNTHPLAYSTDPIRTVATNVIGTRNILEFACKHNVERFVFASSCEIYGENRGDVDKFDENYCGYINCNTLRAGYTESKRCGEALCQAYIEENGIDIVIPRLTRTYGPTMLMTDTKALSQFIKKGIEREDIVLKSKGNQFFSYSYVADAVSGILTVMLKGKSGEAYNIADEKSDITLKDLAQTIANYVGTKVIFELPDEKEKAGFSKATKAILDSSKLQELGWQARYGISEGVKRTIDILVSK